LLRALPFFWMAAPLDVGHILGKRNRTGQPCAQESQRYRDELPKFVQKFLQADRLDRPKVARYLALEDEESRPVKARKIPAGRKSFADIDKTWTCSLLPVPGVANRRRDRGQSDRRVADRIPDCSLRRRWELESRLPEGTIQQEGIACVRRWVERF